MEVRRRPEMLHLRDADLKIHGAVGSGGFGVVRRAWSRDLGMEVALKTLYKGTGNREDELQKEKDKMQRANFTFILRLLATYETKAPDLTIEFGLVMEYMPYGSLHSFFHNIKEVPWSLRFQIIHQVAVGMNFLHMLRPPIIHRDLKPSNVLLNKSLDVQLTDFGLAKYEGSTKSSIHTPGTVSYIPPEAFKEGYDSTTKFDVYSFGILTWSVVTGQEPYNGMDFGVIVACISSGSRPNMKMLDLDVKMVSEAKTLMTKCWDGEPNARPSFKECIRETDKMCSAYQGDINKAVEDVKNLLITHYLAVQASGEDEVYDAVDLHSTKCDSEDTSSSLNRLEHLLKEEVGQKACPDSSMVQETKPALEKISLIPENFKAKDFLKKNLVDIVRANLHMSGILDELFSVGIINPEELSSIEQLRNEDKIRDTLRMVTNKGHKSSLTFLQLLEKYNYSLVESLFDKSK
ncbi:receptor-interacting serine/threonine-protein kinase 3-like [Discoglossus pictus]